MICETVSRKSTVPVEERYEKMGFDLPDGRTTGTGLVVLLLENTRSAAIYLGELGEDEKNGIMSMPIYNLYQQEVDGKKLM